MKFYIDYLDTNGELSHYYTDALTKKEAEEHLYEEMWDVDSVLTIRSSKK